MIEPGIGVDAPVGIAEDRLGVGMHAVKAQAPFATGGDEFVPGQPEQRRADEPVADSGRLDELCELHHRDGLVSRQQRVAEDRRQQHPSAEALVLRGFNRNNCT